MAKPKKNGHYYNIYMDSELYDRLAKYNAETSIPKTAVMEKALRLYLDKVAPKKKDPRDVTL